MKVKKISAANVEACSLPKLFDEEKIVTASDMLHVKLATSGGCAIRFIKQ